MQQRKGQKGMHMEYESESKIKEIIGNCGYVIDISKIDMSSDLVRDFDFASVNLIELVVELESEFGIEFDDDDLAFSKMASYSELVKMINRKMGERSC